VLLKKGVLVCGAVMALALMCGAQNPPRAAAQAVPASAVAVRARQIEVLLRAQFAVPPDYDIVLGLESGSAVAGFDTLPVTFVHQGKQTSVDFLISKDGATLARLEKFNILQNPALSIDVKDRPVRGNPDARIEIVNFDDLECPYCAMLNNEILPATLDRYKGLIKIVYKDFPIEGHPWAARAAVDADCLASLDSSAYWAYVDYVHKNRAQINGPQQDLGKSLQALDSIASRIGNESRVPGPELAMCLKQQDQSIVNASLRQGKSLGQEATPQMFVDGERLPAGARPTSELWPAIDRALKAQGIEPPAKASKSK